ncbi:MAG: tetratricopeptide repeat protein [Anaerolineae bacterium]
MDGSAGADSSIAHGWEAYHRLELDGAQRAFRDAIGKDADAFEGHYGLARTLIRMRREEEARAEVERCLELAPERFESQAVAGLFYFLVDALDEALTALQKAIKLAPDAVESQVVLAQVQADRGAFDDAEAALERARELIDALPDGTEQRRERARLLHAETYVALTAGREDEARAKAEEALELADANPHAVCLANTNLGLMAARHKRWDEAVFYLEAALELNPAFYRARSALGRVHLVAGRPAEAADALEIALEQMPHPEAHTVMAYASALSKTGRREEAVAQYRRALTLHPRWLERVYAWWQIVWQSRWGRIAVIALGVVALLLWLALGGPSPQAVTLVLLVVVVLALQRSMTGKKLR